VSSDGGGRTGGGLRAVRLSGLLGWSLWLLSSCIGLAGTEKTNPLEGQPAIERFREYLRFDTSNPPGKERAAALFLEGLLRRAGIATETYEAAPGRMNLYARLKGSTKLPGLVLHHHIDVVPADASGWSHPPFAAQMGGERLLVGRGAIDDKGPGMAHLEAFLALAGSRLRRDVVFLATADEETGGALGVKAIEKARPAWLEGIGYAIGEGGYVQVVVDRPIYFGIETLQRSALWLRLETSGPGGHAAIPPPDNAAARMAAAVNRLVQWEQPLVVEPEVAEAFRVLSLAKFPGRRELYASLPELVRKDPAKVRAELPSAQLALLSNTVAVTRIGSDSPKVNVLSTTAWAEVDCRLLPSTSLDGFQREIVQRIADPRVKVTVLLKDSGGPLSPRGAFYDLVVRTLRKRFPGTVIGPDVQAGLSENRRFRARGIETYGVTPFRINYYDMAGVHSRNERIRVDWYLEGIETMKDMLAAFQRF
jgi:acetylornithine deacetylase/succinyl-diaminopimelate desuccinylase-like protein